MKSAAPRASRETAKLAPRVWDGAEASYSLSIGEVLIEATVALDAGVDAVEALCSVTTVLSALADDSDKVNVTFSDFVLVVVAAGADVTVTSLVDSFSTTVVKVDSVVEVEWVSAVSGQ